MVGVITYQVNIGQHFISAIREMAEMANRSKAEVKMEFNGKEYSVLPGVDVQEVVDAFEKKLRDEEEEYRKSPECAERERVWAAERLAQTEKFNELWEVKPDFTDLDSVVDWLCKLSIIDSINMSNFGIVEVFEENGYLPNAYTYDKFDIDSREIFARWLIGQALDGINIVGAIHPVFMNHAKQWKTREFRKD